MTTSRTRKLNQSSKNEEGVYLQCFQSSNGFQLFLLRNRLAKEYLASMQPDENSDDGDSDDGERVDISDKLRRARQEAEGKYFR